MMASNGITLVCVFFKGHNYLLRFDNNVIVFKDVPVIYLISKHNFYEAISLLNI